MDFIQAYAILKSSQYLKDAPENVRLAVATAREHMMAFALVFEEVKGTQIQAARGQSVFQQIELEYAEGIDEEGNTFNNGVFIALSGVLQIMMEEIGERALAAGLISKEEINGAESK